MAAAITPEKFVEKWSRVELPERSASQEHFIDLCRLIGHPTPGESDQDQFMFEKAVVPVGAASRGSRGDRGFVDVWKRGAFTWEYKRKGKYKDLHEAYRQAVTYRDALDNPPLTVVCDIERTIIHTHFVGYPKVVEELRLEELPGRLGVIRRVFENPFSFKPEKTSAQLTTDLAAKFGDVARRLVHGAPPEAGLFAGVDAGLGGKMAAAHFLMKVVFCLFAEDIKLLPENLFKRTVERAIREPELFPERARRLFELMATGGEFGEHEIPWFNGGLFARGDDHALLLNQTELRTLHEVAKSDWHGVDPSIFGTLFERLLDPNKRAQIGAHYTSETDIRLVTEPVIMAPLRKKWDGLKSDLAAQAVQAAAEDDDRKRQALGAPIAAQLATFRQDLGKLKILDPACGSGNSSTSPSASSWTWTTRCSAGQRSTA